MTDYIPRGPVPIQLTPEIKEKCRRVVTAFLKAAEAEGLDPIAAICTCSLIQKAYEEKLGASFAGVLVLGSKDVGET